MGKSAAKRAAREEKRAREEAEAERARLRDAEALARTNTMEDLMSTGATKLEAGGSAIADAVDVSTAVDGVPEEQRKKKGGIAAALGLKV